MVKRVIITLNICVLLKQPGYGADPLMMGAPFCMGQGLPCPFSGPRRACSL